MFALCDQRSFYASCEAVFRPDIRGEPICVLSNNDGCVVALNEPAKSVGVKKFEPYFMQRDLITRHKVHAFSSNYALYDCISRRIMDTLRAHTPAVEVYSIDEGFCDLTGIAMKQLKPLAANLVATVWREQRIPMGVSVGPTKTLAKLGQFATKKLPQINGVAVLTEPHQWQWLAKRTPVEEVWGVGRRLTEKLNALGIDTAFQLASMPVSSAQQLAGVTLVRTVRELNGEACIPMELNPPSKQQIISSRSFGNKVYKLNELQEAVSGFALRASEKLRQQDSLAGTLSVMLVSGRHQRAGVVDRISVQLPGGCDDARRFSREAAALTRALFVSGRRYVKAGVELWDIRPAAYWQMDWLENNAAALQPKSAMDVLDAINRRYGRDTVTLGRQAGQRRFAMRRQLLSPQYLTQWRDIPVLKC